MSLCLQLNGGVLPIIPLDALPPLELAPALQGLVIEDLLKLGVYQLEPLLGWLELYWW